MTDFLSGQHVKLDLEECNKRKLTQEE